MDKYLSGTYRFLYIPGKYLSGNFIIADSLLDRFLLFSARLGVFSLV